jgi:hypothetical protein
LGFLLKIEHQRANHKLRSAAGRVRIVAIGQIAARAGVWELKPLRHELCLPANYSRCGWIKAIYMENFMLLAQLPVLAAIGYSLVYLLAGGGLGGAILIFIIAKMLGR